MGNQISLSSDRLMVRGNEYNNCSITSLAFKTLNEQVLHCTCKHYNFSAKVLLKYLFHLFLAV